MFYSIDRFEEDFAVLISDEDSSGVCVPRNCIPEDAKEGSILTLKDGEYIYDPEETARRRRAFFLRTRNLSKK